MNSSMDSTYQMTEAITNGIRTVPVGDEPRPVLKTHVYKRRFWVLSLFSFTSMLCGMMFTLYTSMANVNVCYYGVSQEAISWTAMLFMVVYIVLVIPVSYLINRIDLRCTVMLTIIFNTIASATEFATLSPDSFAFVIVTSFFSSLSNVFVLGIPPFLAAKWFPTHELSRACAFGVFGNQLGVAVGFLFSPLMVTSDCTKKYLIREGKQNVAIIQTAVNAVTLILIIFTFQNAPEIPPSLAQVEKRKDSPEPYKMIVLRMIKNVHFMMIFVVYGLMVGLYFTLTTILNNLILRFFPNKEVEIGYMGALFIVCGLVGSMIAGYILDCTLRFKETFLGICIASLMSCILFSSVLYLEILWVQFLAIGIFGFFLTSFLPIGFEYGIEMIYPLSESVCACLLNSSTMIFGIILTEIASHVLQSYGAHISNAVFVITLLICCIVTSFITKDYKRSKKISDVKCNISS